MDLAPIEPNKCGSSAWSYDFVTTAGLIILGAAVVIVAAVLIIKVLRKKK